MTMDQELGVQKAATLSPMELRQVKDAVSELRATSPRSALADLVDEKIRAIENGYSSPRCDFPAIQGWRIFS